MTNNQNHRTPPSQNWHALYTKSRNEKKVQQQLLDLGIETYLPLIKVLKQWSDRKKWVEEPLFKSYIFVHISPEQYNEVLSVHGIVRYIAFEGKAVSVPPTQITAIKQFINEEDSHDKVYQNFQKGDKIEIIRGSLSGLLGHFVEVKGKQKVQIEIESIGHSITLTIPKSYLKLINVGKSSAYK